MNRQEAYIIVSRVLERCRDDGFHDLVSRVGTTASEEAVGPSSTHYTVDVSIAWAAGRRSTLEVHARIDDQNSFRFGVLEERIFLPDPDPVEPQSGFA